MDNVPMLSGAEPPQSFSGYEPKRLYLPNEQGTYDDCAYVDGFDSRKDGRSLVSADLDGDGDLDLVMTNRNTPRVELFENAQPVGGSVQLRLRSTRGHPEADGAVVLVEGLGAFPVLLARGYASTVDPAVHVGLGARASVKVKVRWRSQLIEDFGAVTPGARYELVEGAGVAKPVSKYGPGRLAAKQPWPAQIDALALPPSAAPDAGAQPTVVQLFMESCKPCRDEVPALNAVAAKGRARVVGLGLHPAEQLPRAKAALKMTYEVAPLPEPVAQAFEVHGSLTLPTLLVYGPAGELLRVVPGGKSLAAVLTELGL